MIDDARRDDAFAWLLARLGDYDGPVTAGDADWPEDECDVCGDAPCERRDCAIERYERGRLDREERDAARGTSGCDGACVPQCSWCLVSHACPDQCGGGDGCPYEALARERRA